MLLTTTTLLSQRAPPRRCGLGFAGKPSWDRVFRLLCEKAKRGYASRVPLPCGAAARRTGGVLVEGVTPLFLPLVRQPASVHRRTQWRTINTPLEGGRSLHSDPGGKAEMLKTWARVVLLNPTLTAAEL